MQFKDKTMKYKCVRCQKEHQFLYEALEHRDYECFEADIVTPETIDKWNKRF